MKDFIVKIGEKLFIPTCVLFIAYCIFYQYIEGFYGIFFLKLILFLSSLLLVVTWIIRTFASTKRDSKMKLSNNSLVRKFYIQSQQIISWGFSCYFAIYLIFFLDKKSVLYNYLILLLLGLYLGYEIAVIASRYKK